MTNTHPSLSIIFPIHNEEHTIDELITTTIAICSTSRIPFEILAIENGSTDKSFQLLSKWAKKDKRITVYRSEKGWGNAVQEGIAHASKQLCTYMVSDLQVSPHSIIDLYKKYLDTPLDTRHTTLYKITRKNRENPIRFFVSFIYNIVAFILLGLPVHDINATPKLLSTTLLKSIELISHDIGIDAELLYVLNKKKIAVIEIPVRTRYRSSGSSSTNWKSMFDMLATMMQLRLSSKK